MLTTTMIVVAVATMVGMLIGMLWLDHNIFNPIINSEKSKLNDYPLRDSLHTRFVEPVLVVLSAVFIVLALICAVATFVLEFINAFQQLF